MLVVMVFPSTMWYARVLPCRAVPLNTAEQDIERKRNPGMTVFWDLCPDDGCSKHFRNVSLFLRDCTAKPPRSHIHTCRCENLKSHKEDPISSLPNRLDTLMSVTRVLEHYGIFKSQSTHAFPLQTSVSGNEPLRLRGRGSKTPLTADLDTIRRWVAASRSAGLIPDTHWIESPRIIGVGDEGEYYCLYRESNRGVVTHLFTHCFLGWSTD